MDTLGFGVEGENSPLDEALSGPERPVGPQDLGEAPASETPQEPPPPSEPAEPASEAPTDTPAPEPAADPPAPEAEEKPEGEGAPVELLGGRFKTPEDAVEAWRQAESFGTRAQQARLAAENQVKEIQAKLQSELPRLIEQEVQRRLQMDPDAEPEPLSPDKVQELVKAEAQRLTQEQEMARIRTEVQNNYAAFRSAHPEIDDALDRQVVNLFGEYREQLDEAEQQGFLPTKDRLETMFTLVQNPRVRGMLDKLNLVPDPDAVTICEELVAKPELAKVVQAHPHVVESEAGMEWAREQATRPQAIQSQAQQDLAARQAAEAEVARKAAHVETGATGGTGGSAPAQSDEQWFIESVSREKADNAIGL